MRAIRLVNRAGRVPLGAVLVARRGGTAHIVRESDIKDPNLRVVVVLALRGEEVVASQWVSGVVHYCVVSARRAEP